ncbi:MAG: apolipoprotein N-acyltransferase, partial [Pseudomonadota bacterium]
MIASRTLEKTGHSIILLSGWRMQILCISAGALTALGQAPFHLIAFMAISFPVFVFLLDGAVAAPGKRGLAALMPAFWRGWLFGFGYFVAGLWWLGSAFLVNADRFAALLPLGVIALPAALAFFYAFAALIARMFWTTGYRRIVVLAASFALIEWLRTFILTGFPWNSLGYLLAINDTLMQAMALTGTHAYTFFAVLIFASPALFGDSPDDHALRQAKRGQRGRATFLSLVVILLCAIVGYGLLRLQNAPPIATLDDETNVTSVDDVVLRVVQPNILQKDKFKPEKAREILDRHLNLSRRITGPEDLGLLQTTHLIWP